MAIKKPAKSAKKSSQPMGASLSAFEFDDTAYDIDRLARNAVLKHPAVQKRIESMKQKLSKHVNGHGSGVTQMPEGEGKSKAPKGSTDTAMPRLAGPAQVVSTRMPRQDKAPKPKARKGSRTSY